MSKYTTTLEWIKKLEELKKKGIKIVHRSALEALYTRKQESLSVILHRLTKRGVITHITKNWYAIATVEPWETITTVFPSAYISLEWALSYHEIIDQKINIITAVWLGKTKTIKTKLYTIELHKITKKLYFGFDNKRIANPEKALLDTAYIRKDIPKEINTELLDKNKLREYSRKYPKTTQELLKKRKIID